MPTTNNDDAIIVIDTTPVANLDVFAQDPSVVDLETIERGPAGKDATINGVNTLFLTAEDGISAVQDGDTLTLSIDPATTSDIDDASNEYKPLAPATLYYSVIRALAYNNLDFTTAERAAALSWLGVNNSTITLTQGGETKGSFTLNQDGDATIELDDGQTIQLEEMPLASEEYVGPIYQYIGIDTQDYEHGYFYECVEVSQDTYEWQQRNVQPRQSAYFTFPSTWPTDSTTMAFCNAVAEDPTAVVGNAYLGEVTFTDISSLGIGNAEISVEIMSGTTTYDKVILLTMTSGNVSPYLWKYTYWNHGASTSGWVGFQPKLTPGTGIEITSNSTISAVGLKNKNTATGATNPVYDWVGTLAQFTSQNIASQHPDWICYITDDEGGNGVVYSAAECNTLFATKTEVTNSLLNKVNVDADNFTSIGKVVLSSMGKPDFTHTEPVTLLASGSEYTAPANGYFLTSGKSGSGNIGTVQIINTTDNTLPEMRVSSWATGGAGRACGLIYPIKNGEKINFYYGSTTTDLNLYFIYDVGVEE